MTRVGRHSRSSFMRVFAMKCATPAIFDTGTTKAMISLSEPFFGTDFHIMRSGSAAVYEASSTLTRYRCGVPARQSPRAVEAAPADRGGFQVGPVTRPRNRCTSPEDA